MGQNPGDLLADPPEQLRAFVRDGRITAVPAKRTRRRLLLDQVAQAFEPGRKYPAAVVDSSSFTHIGIAVYRAPTGTVWLTQDFSN